MSLQLLPKDTDILNSNKAGSSNKCSECQILGKKKKKQLEAESKKKFTLLTIMKFIEQVKIVVTIDKEAVPKVMKEKSQILELLVELKLAKERFRKLTIGD